MYTNFAKDFDWAIEVNGLNQFLVQDVKLPALGVGTVTSGTAGPVPNLNTPGKPTVGDLVVQKLCPAYEAETWAYEWMSRVIAGDISATQITGFFKRLRPGAQGETTRYFFQNMWPKNIDPSNFTAQGENNVIETVTFEVQIFYPVNEARFKQIFK